MKLSITDSRPNRIFKIRRIVGLAVSLAIIAFLYSKLDFRELIRDLFRLDPAFVPAVLGTFILIYAMSAWRWKIIAAPYQKLSFYGSLKLTGAASTLNMIMPSKMGSFIKAYALFSEGKVAARPALAVIIYEKLMDMVVMAIFFLIFAIIENQYNALTLCATVVSVVILFLSILVHVIPLRGVNGTVAIKRAGVREKLAETLSAIFIYARSPELRQTGVVKLYLITFLTWIVHSIQILLFFHMIGVNVSFATILSRMYAAIFVGLIPVTVAGIGTRDLSIVYLFEGFLTYGQSLSIGIFSTMRYFVPMILGFPFFLTYVLSRDPLIRRKTYVHET